uniref:Ankyrin repeat-containing protein n=1 Tax=Borely moumouvirus TaxID=2712067 RepID=A0A6G6ABJ9_9VIRU
MIKLLLDKGADINAINIYGRTPLISACIYDNKCDNLETIKLLLEYWPNINLKNNDGKNSLDIASQYLNGLGAVKILILKIEKYITHTFI